jgi:hypothetical protein
MPARFAEMAAIGHTSLLDTKTSERSAQLRFRDDPGTRARLASIVAAESECCAFLTMSLRAEPDAITLAIETPAGAEPVLAELVQAFVGASAEGGSVSR